jgi:hypothetical protein
LRDDTNWIVILKDIGPDMRRPSHLLLPIIPSD